MLLRLLNVWHGMKEVFMQVKMVCFCMNNRIMANIMKDRLVAPAEISLCVAKARTWQHRSNSERFFLSFFSNRSYIKGLDFWRVPPTSIVVFFRTFSRWNYLHISSNRLNSRDVKLISFLIKTQIFWGHLFIAN